MNIFAKPHSPLALACLVGATLIGGGIAAADQVIPDDLIVQGSACVGLDCFNNFSFGFDTLVLRENNLRILFQDTSVGTFPTNDWRLQANGAETGNFFALQDANTSRLVFRIDAGAPIDSFRMDQSGRIGLGTAVPVLKLHLNTSDTPAQRFEQNNGGGYKAQTWDIAGNEANFFIRDVTGGSRLPFRIQPGAPTSTLGISAAGDVGIGTFSPERKLDIIQESDSYFTGLGIQNAAHTRRLNLWVDTANVGRVDGGAGNDPVTINGSGTGNVGIGTASPAARLHTVGTVRFAGVASCGAGIQSNANGDLSCIASSRQFKTITGDLPSNVALANVMALRPQTGSYKETPDVPEHWFIAEEVAAIDPALAGLNDGRPHVVKTQNVVADLVAVVQQQQRQIEALERRLPAK